MRTLLRVAAMGTAWMVLCTFAAAAVAAPAGEVLFADDFEQAGPLDSARWKLAHGKPPVPSRYKGFLANAPQKMLSSQTVFSQPVSVEFSGVFMAAMPVSGDNHLGLAPGGYGPDVVSWVFTGFRDGPIKVLVPYRRVGGRNFRIEGNKYAIDLTKLPDLTKPENAVNLRIDWWPGKMVVYYFNGKRVAEFTKDVPDVAVPLGVRDETVYFRIGSVKVTRIAKSADAILEERKRRKTSAWKARRDARVKGVSAQFPKLRMVIGGPCYFWGIDTVIKSDLTQAGMDVLVWPDAPLLGVHAHAMGQDPMLYNIIIFGDPFYHLIQPDPNTGEIPKRIRDQVPMLRRFLEAGGGVWFCGLGEQNLGKSSHALNYILKELGLDAEVLGEVVKDSTQFKGRGARYPYNAWVDVLPDPLTQGVAHLLHPSGVIGSQGSMGVAPVARVGPQWRVLVKGRTTAASFPYDRTVDHYNRLVDKPGTVKASPILCAVRQAGKGRVVLWPTWSNFTVTGGSGGMVIAGEQQGRRSDGARLIENLLCWLAEPSQASKTVGIFDPKTFKKPDKKVDIEGRLRGWCKPGRRDYPREYKVLIGAHSNLSDGRSSPGAMIAAAKKAGYDFMAFTENFARIDEAKWQQLLAACDKANKADSTFVAYPGLDFMDYAGNRCLHFGQRYWIKDEWRAGEKRDRIRWFYNFAYGADADAKRWRPRAVIRSQTNAKRPWNQGLWNLFGAYCYEGGKLVDDSFHEWRQLIGRHVFFLNSGISAIHTVRSADEIAAAARPGLYQTRIKAQNLAQVLSRISGCTGPGWMGCFPVYVTAGPGILDFRCYVAEVGGEICFDLAVPGNDRGWLHLLTESDSGLKEIEVYDCERLVRRFRPNGKKRFEHFMPVHADSYHSFSMTVTDRDGRKATSWNAFLQIAERVHRRCGDNYNWMTTGKRAGTLIPPKFTYQLHEITHGWTTRDPEEEPKPARPLYSYTSGNYGHGGVSAAINCYVSPFADYLVDGKPREGLFPVVTMDFDTIGRFGIIVTNHTRQDYAVKKRPPFGTYGAFAGPHRVAPCPWPADLKQFVPASRPDGLYLSRIQGKVTFTKPVADRKGAPLHVQVGGVNPHAKVFEVMNPDGTSKRHKLGADTVTGEVPVNGYICWYDEDGDGVGGLIALSPGVRYSYKRQYATCWLEQSSPAKPGDKLEWDVIYVTGSRATSNSNAQMEDLRTGMGIVGKPTLYEVRPKIGKVVDRKLLLTLDTSDHGFSGKIVKTSGRLLPIHLPVMVRGLNPRWSAVLWYRGRTHLHTVDRYQDRWGLKTWRWNIATYEPRVDEVRHIPILEDGLGYCQLETDKQDPDVFIGNPLVCDQAQTFLTLTTAGRGKCTFEINNPTDRILTCTVRPAKGFDLTGKWTRKLTLPAGAVETMTVEHGS